MDENKSVGTVVVPDTQKVHYGRVKKIVCQSVLHFVIILTLFLTLYPLVLLIFKSFKDIPQDQMDPFTLTFPLHFGNYRTAWLNVQGYIGNSFIITIFQTVGTLLVASISSFAFVRFRFPLKNFIFLAFLSLIMIPGTLTLVSQYILVNNLGLVNTFAGVFLPAIAGSIPMNVFLLRSFFGGVNAELFDAAKIDGAGDLRTFWSIMLPLSMPILLTVAMTTFMGAWNEYVWTRLVLLSDSKHTIAIGVYSFTNNYYAMTGGYGAPFAAYIISAVPLIVVFALTSKQFIKGLTSGAFKM